MAGRGPQPKDPAARTRRNSPPAAETTTEVGWQHGDIPPAPAKLLKTSREAWAIWMGSWFAAHWAPEDLPGLRQVVRLYDQVERGEFGRHTQCRIAMDTYGITPKGQQDRHWAAPWVAPVQADRPAPGGTTPKPGARYGHLRSVEAG
jgi:hypothetical protein